MTQATAILRQIGAEAKPRLRSVRDWLTCICTEYSGESPSVTIPITPGTAHLNLPPGIPIPGITHPIDDRGGAVPSSDCLPASHPPSRNATPDMSWKPWVEPFQPQRAVSALPSTVESFNPSSGSTTATGTAGTTYPPTPATSNSTASEHIWAPAPRQLPVSWDSWRSAPPPAYQPTPPPFNYSATYEYAWPLPGASNRPQGNVVPMKRPASTLLTPANHASGSAVRCFRTPPLPPVAPPLPPPELEPPML